MNPGHAGAVTLQINLAPGDWRLAEHLLPHQIRTWRPQVSEILITVDLHRSAGRFAADWDAGRDRILEIARRAEGAAIRVVGMTARSKSLNTLSISRMRRASAVSSMRPVNFGNQK